MIVNSSTYQVVELNGANTLVDTRDDFLCDSSSIDMLRIKTITQSRHTSRDLIELYTLFASVCKAIPLVQSKSPNKTRDKEKYFQSLYIYIYI